MGQRTLTQASTSQRATAIGFTAILMWSTLALLTTLTGGVPPFQLTAMAFTIAFVIGLIHWVRHDRELSTFLDLPREVWLLGVGGLFGYHFFYFLALRLAPAVEASLIAYLWPLLIVLLSSALPGERLRWFHTVGGLTGFLGAVLLITGGKSISIDWAYAPGYLAALICALTWSVYSVLSRRWGAVPTSAVGGFCGVTALLAWTSHVLLETTVWPEGWQWAAVAALGVGPVGLAFFVWDWGVKHGDIRTLGVLSYLAPLLSTFLLIAAGRASLSWILALACVLIVGGAILASGVMRRNQESEGTADSPTTSDHDA